MRSCFDEQMLVVILDLFVSPRSDSEVNVPGQSLSLQLRVTCEIRKRSPANPDSPKHWYMKINDLVPEAWDVSFLFS